MSYTKQTWANGDVITADKLNHIEDGIETTNNISPFVVNFGNEEIICYDGTAPYSQTTAIPHEQGDAFWEMTKANGTLFSVIFDGVRYDGFEWYYRGDNTGAYSITFTVGDDEVRLVYWDSANYPNYADRAGTYSLVTNNVINNTSDPHDIQLIGYEWRFDKTYEQIKQQFDNGNYNIIAKYRSEEHFQDLDDSYYSDSVYVIILRLQTVYSFESTDGEGEALVFMGVNGITNQQYNVTLDSNNTVYMHS